MFLTWKYDILAFVSINLVDRMHATDQYWSILPIEVMHEARGVRLVRLTWVILAMELVYVYKSVTHSKGLADCAEGPMKLIY